MKSNYYFENEAFVLEDYDKLAAFSDFLPAVAGIYGKPAWLFYCNRGQGVSTFGVNGKEGAMLPFVSALTAYKNTAKDGFRTFICRGGVWTEAFSPLGSGKRKMKIYRHGFSVSEETDDYFIEARYSTVTNRPFAGIVRDVVYRNKGVKTDTEIVDGLPLYLPAGFGSYNYHQMSTLFSAYCKVENGKSFDFYKMTATTEDVATVRPALQGHVFCFLADGKTGERICDPAVVFGSDDSYFLPKGLKETRTARRENLIPCAFGRYRGNISENGEVLLQSLFAYADDMREGRLIAEEFTSDFVRENERTAKSLIDGICAQLRIKTADSLFDAYVGQCVLDNSLRGGMPLERANRTDGVTYVFGRKHGDMERDYNAFFIPAEFFSNGNGNFRDVNQNRRSDLFSHPAVFDYNVKQFFELIQADGYNPLTVDVARYSFSEESIGRWEKQGIAIEKKAYTAGEIYALAGDKETFYRLYADTETARTARYGEGYWIDHFVYNADLLENFLAVYPDKTDVLFEENIRFFFSPVFVEPRRNKYFLTDVGVRQINAIDAAKTDKKCRERGLCSDKADWLKDKYGNVVYTSVAAKLFHLIAIKFSSLDCRQAGIEMEAGKPGWCDALNGLPALFGSGFGETEELTSMTALALDLFSEKDRDIRLLKEQKTFIDRLYAICRREDLSPFEIWDEMTSAREDFRLCMADGCDGEKETVSASYVCKILKAFYAVLSASVEKNGKGIPPTYFAYEATKYRVIGEEKNGLTPVEVMEFTPRALPLFLEGAARSCKLPRALRQKSLPARLRESEIYDCTLGVYKTSASLEDESVEIGRIRNFSPGWLERESDFLHMDYKYLLGLLKGGYEEDFYREIKTNLVCYMSPERYKRNPLENVSFIASSINRNKETHGQGFYARLTGATCELLSMVWLMFLGERPFVLKEGKLAMHVCPKLAKKYLDNGRASILLFGSVEMTIVNETEKECYDCLPYRYEADGCVTEGEYLSESDSLSVRLQKVKSLTVYLR